MNDRHIISFHVNGDLREVEVGRKTSLLQVLRDELHLTGTKNGCGQGHCGACTVIVDGKAVRSCVYLAHRADGKQVETIEGLARDGELHPLQKAFIEHGAIQCGFCTPGMIMAAKALLDAKPRPTREDIYQALERNLCRCTGYAKIIEAILAASGQWLEVGEARPLTFASGVADPSTTLRTGLAPRLAVGHPLPRPDARAKATGEAVFAADLYPSTALRLCSGQGSGHRFEGMLHGKVLRSRYPHARVLRVDASQAKALPGVVAVLTAADVPGARNHGLLHNDWPVLAYDKVRYVGDAIALVAAETEHIAEAALELIEIDYEPLPVVASAESALAEDAPLIHEEGNVLKHLTFQRGDVEAAFAQADIVIENEYRTPASDHSFLEPEAGVAIVDDEGSVTVYAGSQIPFDDQRQIAASLALPWEKVRVVQTQVGGAFGGKEDIHVQIHAALLAQATGRPVKLVFTRQESMIVHPKRHATVIRLKTGATKAGKLLAVQAHIVGDTGAYASLGEPVMTRTATHASGLYEISNFKVVCYAVHTNNPPAGAYRGFGVPQATFASETQMDILAKKLEMSPFELRRINALKVGATTATGQTLRESVGLLECLERVEEKVKAAEGPEETDSAPSVRRGWGVACAYKNVGLGEGLADSAGAELELLDDGRAIVRAGAAEVGQGLVGVLAQMVVEELGVDYGKVEVILGDTGQCLDGGPTTASRQTYVTGNAVRYAARQVRQALAGAVAEELDAAPDTLVFREARVSRPDGRSISLEEAIALARREGRSLDASHVYTPPETVPLEEEGDKHFAYGYAAQVAQVEVDITSGEVRVLKVIAAHDVGRAVNPMAVEGQLEGGVIMGLGYALTEEFKVEEGRVLSDSFAKYKVPRIHQIPEIVPIIVEHEAAEGPYGAKGVGEITSIPTTAAITNAIYAACGARIFSLPATPTKIRAALEG
jgi:xanthine dehydrogenase molybdenum-binding subunit